MNAKLRFSVLLSASLLAGLAAAQENAPPTAAAIPTAPTADSAAPATASAPTAAAAPATEAQTMFSPPPPAPVTPAAEASAANAPAGAGTPVAILPSETPTAAANPNVGMETLEGKLDELQLPANVAPAAVRQEKLYSVQNRYTDLHHRSEISLGGGKNFTGNSFLNMSQVDLTYRYHFTDKWNLAASGSYGFNSFTDSANALIASDGIMPDAAYVKYRADLLLGYNLFYGKFRLSMDNVLYFDQYLAVGPGIVGTQYGSSPAGVVDIGFVLWTGKNMDVRFGLKNDFFNEKTLTTSGLTRHTLGHIEVGYSFGGTGRAANEL